MRRLSLIVICLLLSHSIWSFPKQLRATWLTTVVNIDWPQTTGADAQKAELSRMLDSIAALNMNAVFFQVRSCADAMYASSYEPWSMYLGNGRGTAPGYDPLLYCIDECHKRGLECHAWLNPYRYSRTGEGYSQADDDSLNYERQHPEWLLYYKKQIILNPGLPEVTERICLIVKDIITRYEVDGIVFDDYFYPYGGTTNQDMSVFQSAASVHPDLNIHDWRRANVNNMIKTVHDTIKYYCPTMPFGVSPFGIWTMDSTVAASQGIELPKGISGSDMYKEIYCDPVAWLKDGSVDYISPQLYWKTGGKQDYRTLVHWWTQLAERFGVRCYPSIAMYKYGPPTKKGVYSLDEMLTEIALTREASKDSVSGVVFYNTSCWMHRNVLRTAIRKTLFAEKAETPFERLTDYENIGNR